MKIQTHVMARPKRSNHGVLTAIKNHIKKKIAGTYFWEKRSATRKSATCIHFQQFLLHAFSNRKTLENSSQIKFLLKKPLEDLSQIKFPLKKTSNMSLQTLKLQILLLLFTNFHTKLSMQINFLHSLSWEGIPMRFFPSYSIYRVLCAWILNMATNC